MAFWYLNKEQNFIYQKIHEKICDTLFTFKLHSAELLSFWRDFSHKIRNSNFTKIMKKFVKFKLHRAELLSFWRDFFFFFSFFLHKIHKIQTFNKLSIFVYMTLLAILVTIWTKITFLLFQDTLHYVFTTYWLVCYISSSEATTAEPSYGLWSCLWPSLRSLTSHGSVQSTKHSEMTVPSASCPFSLSSFSKCWSAFYECWVGEVGHPDWSWDSKQSVLEHLVAKFSLEFWWSLTELDLASQHWRISTF